MSRNSKNIWWWGSATIWHIWAAKALPKMWKLVASTQQCYKVTGVSGGGSQWTHYSRNMWCTVGYFTSAHKCCVTVYSTAPTSVYYCLVLWWFVKTIQLTKSHLLGSRCYSYYCGFKLKPLTLNQVNAIDAVQVKAIPLLGHSTMHSSAALRVLHLKVFHGSLHNSRALSTWNWLESATAYYWAHARSFSLSRWQLEDLHLEKFLDLISVPQFSKTRAVVGHIKLSTVKATTLKDLLVRINKDRIGPLPRPPHCYTKSSNKAHIWNPNPGPSGLLNCLCFW